MQHTQTMQRDAMDGRIHKRLGLNHFLLAFLTLILVSITNTKQASASLSSNTNTYKIFLKKSCSSTTYPNLCYSSLDSYTSSIKTSQQKLAIVALTVAIKSAKNATSSVTKLSKQHGLRPADTKVVKDCVDNVKDTVYEVKQSLQSLGHLGSGSDSAFHMDDVKSWVSAAITDETTCTDELDEGKIDTKVRARVRKSILAFAHLTSNALSIINSLPN